MKRLYEFADKYPNLPYLKYYVECFHLSIEADKDSDLARLFYSALVGYLQCMSDTKTVCSDDGYEMSCHLTKVWVRESQRMEKGVRT